MSDKLVAIKGIEMTKNCSGCLSCIFRWSGGSNNYCVAQGYKDALGFSHIHRIDYTEWEKISKECENKDERYIKQMTWKEPTCPLIEVDYRSSY